MSRNITDAELVKSVALAAAGSSSSTASIDLGGAGVAALEVIDLKMDIPALPALADTKTVSLTVEDSEDNSTFDAVEGLATLVVTGASGNGSAAASRRVKLPPYTRRYVRVKAEVLAAAGDNTGESFSMSILT